MIALSRPSNGRNPEIRVLGVGGAGSNALDRLVLDGIDGASAIALNTDVQSLTGSVAHQKVHLGKQTTRGLGAGGDPEVGYAAADEASDDIRAAVQGADLIFICVGLGGGTGSGAAPLVAHLGRQAGAVVVAFATLPFAFEGKRRNAQAAEALAQLEQQADLVICFENDRLGEAVAPTAGIQQAFVAADQTLSQSIRGIAALVQRRGLIQIGLDELATALRRQDARCLFGHGESEGANRAHEALERALKSPLMDKGKMLAEAQSVLVHVAGGTDLLLNEVTILMEELNRHISDSTQILFGVSTDSKAGKKLAVTLISATGVAVTTAAEAAPARAALPPPALSRREPAAAPAAVSPDEVMEPVGEELTLNVAQADGKGAAAGKKEEKAEQMQLEPANRGRFEKSEPTIIDGQDLDVPTFLRRNLKLRQ
jgi:cell division protein FtsZ